MRRMSMFGIGIIGLQGYGRTYFKQIAELPFARVAAVCDANEKVLAQVADTEGIGARYSDYREMLKDSAVNVVFIATPHYLHYQMTLDALNAGKHVFCEKPLAMNARQAEDMAARAREKGLLLSCHYNRRQSTAVKMLVDARRKGLLGEVYQTNVKWMARYTAFMFAQNSSWRVRKDKAGGGILIGRGSHMIDAALYILGMPEVKSVSACISSRLTGFEVDDYAMVSLRLMNGAAIHVECSYENNIPQYEEKIEYQLFGTKGGAYSLQQDGQTQFMIGRCEFPENRWIDLGSDMREQDYVSAYPQSIVRDFLEALRDGREPLITGENGAHITRILDAAYRSSAQGCEIEIGR
jgi:predicted dehydrogenase